MMVGLLLQKINLYDLANRSYGKIVARKIVYIGFFIGISFTLLFSTNFADLISVRIAIGSGVAFLLAQLLDVQIFDNLRKNKWFIAPLTSSIIGSATAILVAQLLDVQIFDNLRKKEWFIAPFASSIIGSTVDTFLFFSISFYATGVPWITLSLGDLTVKILVALIMLIPFRLLLNTFKPV